MPVSRSDLSRRSLNVTKMGMKSFFVHGSCDTNSMNKVCGKNEKDRVMRGAMEGVSIVGKGDYRQELHKAEHVDPFRWTPTPEMVERLKQAMRAKKKHS